MIQAIELKTLELFNRAVDALRRERGQTTAEYVIVTAIAVAIAIAVLWVVLKEALEDAVGAIADAISSFISSTL